MKNPIVSVIILHAFAMLVLANLSVGKVVVEKKWTPGQAWWVVVGGLLSFTILLGYACYWCARWSGQLAIQGLRDTFGKRRSPEPPMDPDIAREIEELLK